jgi:hypothetical protein
VLDTPQTTSPSTAKVHASCAHFVFFDACSKRGKLGSNLAQVPKSSAVVFVVSSKINAAQSSNEAKLRQISRGAMDAKRRRQVWVERQNFQGWACTECAWVFSASGPPVGNSLEEMKQNYEQRRDKEFASHVCAQHPRAEKDPR